MEKAALRLGKRKMVSKRVYRTDLEISHHYSRLNHQPNTKSRFLNLTYHCQINSLCFTPQNITTDDRAWLMYRLMSMDISQTYAYFYPRVISVHDIADPNVIPTPVRCIYERLKDDGMYLLENGLVMYLWLGVNLDPTIVQNLFGVAGTQQLNVEKCKLLELDTPVSTNLRSIINLINEQRKLNLRLIVVRQRENMEIFFKNMLVEDKGMAQGSLSYVEYLYHLHREIKNILSY